MMRKQMARLAHGGLCTAVLITWVPSSAHQDVFRGFDAAVEAYVQERQEAVETVGRPPLTADARALVVDATELAKAIQRRRSDDPQGTLLGPEVAAEIRTRLRTLLASPLGGDVCRTITEVQPKPFPLVVNTRYPRGEPRSTMGVAVLSVLPEVPPVLAYRFAGPHLLLLDRTTELIVDLVPDALPPLPATAASAGGGPCVRGVDR